MGLTWLMEGTQTSGKVLFFMPTSLILPTSKQKKDMPKESVYGFCVTIYAKSDPNPDRLRDCGQRAIN